MSAVVIPLILVAFIIGFFAPEIIEIVGQFIEWVKNR